MLIVLFLSSVVFQGASWSVKRVSSDNADSSQEWSSVSGSEGFDDQPWVKRDLARAQEAVRARSQTRPSTGASLARGEYEFMVSVTEDSGAASTGSS